jgi:hypothetical protein
VRSTSVPIALDWSLPMIRSPSQWPGTARSVISAGRSLIMTMPRILPAGLQPPARASLGPSRSQAAGELAAQLPAGLTCPRPRGSRLGETGANEQCIVDTAGGMALRRSTAHDAAGIRQPSPPSSATP